MDEAEVALVEVGERELVVARAGRQEPAVQLSAPGLPAVAGVGVAAALVLGAAGAEGREVAGRDALPGGVGNLALLDLPGRWGRTDAFGRGRIEIRRGRR